jgi:hypothetical protein
MFSQISKGIPSYPNLFSKMHVQILKSLGQVIRLMKHFDKLANQVYFI